MGQIEPEMLSELLTRHGPALVLYARQWSPTPEDVVQDAFLKLMQENSSPENCVGWLYRAVRNQAISTARNLWRRRRAETKLMQQMTPWFESDPDRQIDAAAIAESMADMPLEQRELIVLRLWSGLSFEEIAELCGTALSTAHRRYVAALATLRERYETCQRVKAEQTRIDLCDRSKPP